MLPVAYAALSLYIIGGMWLVGGAKPHELATRVAAVFLAGVLFLPENLGFDAPGIPPVGKSELAPLVCFVGIAMAKPDLLRSDVFVGGASMFVWVSIAGYFGTTITNSDELVFGPTRRPAISFQDAIATSLQCLLSTASAFWVGKAVFRSPSALEDLLRVIVFTGLIMVPICLFELRMSPQVHKMVYGYSVISFDNIRRSGGFKPVGFTPGGLSMAIFLYTTFAAALALRRAGPSPLTRPKGWWVPGLWALLALSKNMGANVFGLVTFFSTGVGSWKKSLRVASVVTIFSFAYAEIRHLELLDVYAFTDWLARQSPERAASLEYRFVNEDAMLTRAMERPWFGWGGYGRGRVWTDDGVTHTVQDGTWIIVMSASGIAGLVGVFGLIGTPIIGWTRRLEKWAPRERSLAAALIVIVSLRLLDLLPNALFCPTTVFLAGVLSGLKDFQPCPNPARQ